VGGDPLGYFPYNHQGLPHHRGRPSKYLYAIMYSMIIIYFLLLSAIFNFVLGVIVLRADYKNSINQSFFALCSLFSLWVLLNYIFQFQDTEPVLKVIYSLGPFLVTTAILWTSRLGPKAPSRKFTALILAIYTANAILAATILSSHSIIASVTDQFNYKLGPLFAIYAIYLGGLFLGFIVQLTSAYRHSDTELKEQIKYIMTGFFTMVGVGFIVSVLLPLLGYTKLNFLDSPSSAIFVIFSAQAMLKYGTFNTKIIATELFIGMLWIVLLTKILLERSEIAQKSVDIIILIATIVLGVLLVKNATKEISQREQLQKLTGALQITNKKLKQVDAMKTEFISMASHELLTPISAIEGYLSMMLDEKMVEIEDPKARQYMNSIYQSSRRLARLVADLLNVSRLEQGRLAVLKTPVDLNEIIKQVMMELQIKAKENKQTLAYQPGDGVDAKSFGDADKIKEVVVNMAGNALKYTKEGGQITVSTAIWPTEKVTAAWEHLSEHVKNDNRPTDGALQGIVHEKYRELVGDQQLVVTVKDNGVGISPTNLGQLFQKFSRIGDWSTQRVSGTGLGLYISRALVEIHHGRVWADSEGEGKGSTFYFSLPLATHSEEIKALDKEIPQAADAKPLARPAKMEAKRLSEGVRG